MTPSSATGLEAAGVSVRQLPWSALGAAKRIFSADTTIGEYTVEYYEATGEGMGWSAVYQDARELGDFATLDAAKAAAQADYAARIMSAVVVTHPAPVAAQPAEGWEAVKRALSADGAQTDQSRALALLGVEDARQEKLHDLLETIREQIRNGVAPEYRPEGLFENIQAAVYTMRGRTRLMDDAAITNALASSTTPPEGEHALEQRAFHAANDPTLPQHARTLVADLWRAYCLASPTPATAPALTDLLSRDDIRHALEIARMGRPYSDVQGHLYMNERYKSHPGSDAQFTDYGLAHAACVLLNAADDILAALSALPAQPNSSERQKALEAIAAEAHRIAMQDDATGGVTEAQLDSERTVYLSRRHLRALATNPEPKL